MGTPFLCMQLAGVRVVGSKVLKKTSEESVFEMVSPYFQSFDIAIFRA